MELLTCLKIVKGCLIMKLKARKNTMRILGAKKLKLMMVSSILIKLTPIFRSRTNLPKIRILTLKITIFACPSWSALGKSQITNSKTFN